MSGGEKKKKQDNVKHAKFQLKRIIKEIIGIKVSNTRQTKIKASKRTLDARNLKRCRQSISKHE
jgi:hypothetical protein